MKDILSIYDRFAFAVFPCSIIAAQEVILAQSAAWNRHLTVDNSAVRDVRLILDSLDGPAYLPSLRTGLLLSEVEGPEGPRTLFVSNVADGFSSMIYMVSKRLAGPYLSIHVSRPTLKYPRNSFSIISAEREVRTVRSMRDSNAWDFFEKGDPLSFENLSFYGAPLKRDRLTPSIISGYLALFGYGSLDKDFWISAAPAHLICEPEFRLGG